MPAVGRKPPPPGPDGRPVVRHRNRAAHEWTEIEAIPFEGGPKLPTTKPGERTWPAHTRRWWKSLSRMPHCSLWDEADWLFALDTAFVHAAFANGDLKVATELRNREKVMGTTVDFRRDLRIRYVDPSPEELPASVKAIEDYRKMVED